MAKVDFDPDAMERQRIYRIATGSILPRPIGLISTMGRDGRCNVAPFSFFNMLSADPLYLCVSINKHLPDGRQKDTLRNILDTGEFVANIVSEDIAGAMDICGYPYAADIDEFAASGLTPAASRKVEAPTVLESRVNFECRLFQATPLPKSSYTLVVAEVVMMRVNAEVLEASGRINLSRLQPVGRLAGSAYCRTSDVFNLTGH